MTTVTQYGIGDSETWSPCTGHPNDPRTDESGADEIEMAALAVWLREVADPADETLISPDAIAEGLAEIQARHDWVHIARLMCGQQYAQLGILVAGLIEGALERRCRAAAEKLAAGGRE